LNPKQRHNKHCLTPQTFGQERAVPKRCLTPQNKKKKKKNT